MMTVQTRQIRRNRGSLSHSSSHETPGAVTGISSGRERTREIGARVRAVTRNQTPAANVNSAALANTSRTLPVMTAARMPTRTIASVNPAALSNRWCRTPA
jgi:hypothetical protein